MHPSDSTPEVLIFQVLYIGFHQGIQACINYFLRLGAQQMVGGLHMLNMLLNVGLETLWRHPFLRINLVHMWLDVYLIQICTLLIK
jgi:hypothetical protein